MSQILVPFRPLAETTNIAVTASSQVSAVTKLDSGGSVRIVNSGAAVSFVTFGTAASTATTTTSMPMLPNSVETFWLEKEQTHIAVIGTVSNTLYVTFGVGA